MRSEEGIIEVVLHTPCYACSRLARYTCYHRADEAILARLSQPLTHRDVHEVIAVLENLHPQVPVGRCHCGGVGQETTSAEFADRATRQDLNHVADDLSYDVRSLSLDGKVLWEGDLERRQRIMTAPDPSPDEFLAKQEARERVWNEVHARLNSLRQDGEAQPATGYILGKAQLYCRIGADAYRAGDRFHQPDAQFTTEELTVIGCAMRQLANGIGLVADKPFVGIPAEFSHSVVRVLHFEVFAQRGERSDDGTYILDTLLCKHVADGREAAFFNKVPARKPNAAS